MRVRISEEDELVLRIFRKGETFFGESVRVPAWAAVANVIGYWLMGIAYKTLAKCMENECT